ncbi:MAG TPA: helix-turn-helix domain-containing protein [Paraburkholderia sp.]|uniref:helix-turn-helix domain-containing protein n=1 Tax=Paraburkholderia sp. TaxID=1926495 RepID=UPI002B466BED|nr:helix-turn-helix domain-containing protein [Paraburkholderia sp.]HKR40442.1 helix-turn-helix domain-containing protein [Paraburkholderia sp.]
MGSKVIEAVVEGRLRRFQAAEWLQLSERQVSRLCRSYQAAGPAGLVLARRGRSSNREPLVGLRADHGAGKRALYGFRADVGRREAARVPRDDAG